MMLSQQKNTTKHIMGELDYPLLFTPLTQNMFVVVSEISGFRDSEVRKDFSKLNCDQNFHKYFNYQNSLPVFFYQLISGNSSIVKRKYKFE